MARGRSLTGFFEIYRSKLLFEESFLVYLHFFNNKVEIVPASVREQARVEGQGNHSDISFCVFPGEEFCPAPAKLNETSYADHNQSK